MTSRSSEVDLDAREILRYLNELGIRNISGEALRDFMVDLKRLIRCDLEQSSHDGQEVHGPERLHSASTFCSRLRSKRREQSACGPGKCPRERGKRDNTEKRVVVRNVTSAPIIREKVVPPQRRSCSCTMVEPTKSKQEPVKKRPLSSSTNIIKVPIAAPQRKADPVTLYHYYMSLWEKYKANLPGENTWADLRWSVRQKMAGDMHKPAGKKNMAAPTAKELEKRRQGWVD